MSINWWSRSSIRASAKNIDQSVQMSFSLALDQVRFAIASRRVVLLGQGATDAKPDAKPDPEAEHFEGRSSLIGLRRGGTPRLRRVERRVLLAAQRLARKRNHMMPDDAHAERGVDLAATERR